jgi:uncharacterized repeat protein (TIGR01451 family)
VAPINGVCQVSDSDTETVSHPQLSLAKTASATSFAVGSAASYTLTLTNTGSVATTSTSTITDAVPAGLTIGAAPAGCLVSGQGVTCTVPTALAAGASASFVIPVTPQASAGASVTNTASVTGGGDPTCPAQARCQSSVTTAITTSAAIEAIDNNAGSTPAATAIITDVLGNDTHAGGALDPASVTVTRDHLYAERGLQRDHDVYLPRLPGRAEPGLVRYRRGDGHGAADRHGLQRQLQQHADQQRHQHDHCLGRDQ